MALSKLRELASLSPSRRHRRLAYAYLRLLKLDGTLTLGGVPEAPLPVAAFNLILPLRQFAGPAIGGIAETQEMLGL